MSVLKGTVKATQDKTSKKGNAYQRVCIADELGQETWWTSFADTKAHAGDVVTCAVKAMGDGEVIDDIMIDEGGAPPAASAAPSVSRGAPAAPTDDTWHVKDLNIMAQTAFKAMAQNASGSTTDFKDMAADAFKIAVYWDKKSRAYVAGADFDGVKQSLQDDINRQAAEANEAAGAGSAGVGGAVDPNVPPHTGEPAAAFDEDIPFAPLRGDLYAY